MGLPWQFHRRPGRELLPRVHNPAKRGRPQKEVPTTAPICSCRLLGDFLRYMSPQSIPQSQEGEPSDASEFGARHLNDSTRGRRNKELQDGFPQVCHLSLDLVSSCVGHPRVIYALLSTTRSRSITSFGVGSKYEFWRHR